MAMNKTNGFALLLIGFGVLILLGKLGLGLGGLVGFIFPILMVGLGYLGIKNGKSFIGWTLLIIGLIVLFGKMAGLIGWLIAVGLIVYGVSMLKNRSNAA